MPPASPSRSNPRACSRKLKFPATIVFVAVAGEEQGLNGSRHLAKLARAEGWDLEAVLNNDIVGGDTTPGQTGQDKTAVRVFSEGVPGAGDARAAAAHPDTSARKAIRPRASWHARSWMWRRATSCRRAMQAPPAAPAGHATHACAAAGLPSGAEFRRDRFGRGGDHTSFNAEGFAAVRFTEWQENFDHQHQTPRTENGTLQDGSRDRSSMATS